MRRITVWLSIVAFALVANASPAFAIKPTTKPSKPTVTKTQAPKSSTKAPKPVKPSAPKASTTSGSTSAKVTAPKGSSKKSSTPAGSTASTTTTTTSPTTDPTTPVWTNDVAKKLSTKPNQLAKLEAALGLGTLTPEQINGATSGFKNFGQANAAVNTAINNPNIEFADLKALMTGLDMKGEPVTGQTTTYSLGQAKQKLGIADGDDASTSTTTTTTTSTKSKKRTNTTSGGTQ
ncbi:MAG TPA: hypothetical protein VHI98_30460 [Vicinamibacterales bacterium]|jgi:hypothetical protein|nr:hypothetical protein [Vicinamibacterales bacterium]